MLSVLRVTQSDVFTLPGTALGFALHHAVDPVHVVGDLGVDSRLPVPATAVAPADDAVQVVDVVLHAVQRATGVTLTGVHAAMASSAQHVGRDLRAVHVWPGALVEWDYVDGAFH